MRIGIQKQYYTNGQLMYETLISWSDNFVVEKYYKKYHLNGMLSEEVYPDWGKKYYDLGESLATWKSHDYIIIGEYVEKYTTGSVKMKVNYFEGNRIGLMYKYFEDSTIMEVWSYNKGKRKFVKKYFENGNLKTEWLYDKNGVEISKKYYGINGNLIRKS